MANEVVLNTIFQLKRGTSEAWERVNPILRAAEPGYELDTGKMKIGDGVTNWKNLDYFGGSFSVLEDGVSIKLNDAQLLELSGFTVASAGMVPRKNANGELEWYTPIDIGVEEMVKTETFISAVDTQIEEVLYGTETEPGGVMEDYQKTTDTISVSRLVNDDTSILVLNGGSAADVVLN